MLIFSLRHGCVDWIQRYQLLNLVPPSLPFFFPSFPVLPHSYISSFIPSFLSNCHFNLLPSFLLVFAFEHNLNSIAINFPSVFPKDHSLFPFLFLLPTLTLSFLLFLLSSLPISFLLFLLSSFPPTSFPTILAWLSPSSLVFPY